MTDEYHNWAQRNNWQPDEHKFSRPAESTWERPPDRFDQRIYRDTSEGTQPDEYADRRHDSQKLAQASSHCDSRGLHDVRSVFSSKLNSPFIANFYSNDGSRERPAA